MRTNFSNQYFKLSFPSSLSLFQNMYTHSHIYFCQSPHHCSCWYYHDSICTYLFFFSGADLCRGTKNHNLIDNMNKKLEQTHKKISDVKRKCTETAKTCLKMHVSRKKFLLHGCRSSLKLTSFILMQSCFMNSVTQSLSFTLINGCSIVWSLLSNILKFSSFICNIHKFYF